jgi:hypothetical protein
MARAIDDLAVALDDLLSGHVLRGGSDQVWNQNVDVALQNDEVPGAGLRQHSGRAPRERSSARRPSLLWPPPAGPQDAAGAIETEECLRQGRWMRGIIALNPGVQRVTGVSESV